MQPEIILQSDVLDIIFPKTETSLMARMPCVNNTTGAYSAPLAW
jgi:hypothetical protein